MYILRAERTNFFPLAAVRVDPGKQPERRGLEPVVAVGVLDCIPKPRQRLEPHPLPA